MRNLPASKHRLPGVCPGVWMTVTRRLPKASCLAVGQTLLDLLRGHADFVLMSADGRAGRRRYQVIGRQVVGMSMGEDDPRHVHPLGRLKQLLPLVRHVDDQALAALGIDDHVAVVGERPQRPYLDHGQTFIPVRSSRLSSLGAG